MRKLAQVKPGADQAALIHSQTERLALKESLHGELARLEVQRRALEEQLESLLVMCEHTDADGRSAVLGGSTKVCAHCGRVVARRGEKLWQ
jgi:cob(I)alamin adenosyltransferase